jgi:serine/threonine protein kinase
LNRLRRSFEQLVAGVHALHTSGRLHLDLKPGNVLVRRDGRVVVLDFGLVRDIEGGLTLSDPTVSGTPAYMAPEQVASARPSAATDWYAVGSMLYEALTGTHPYTGHAVAVLMSKVSKDPPPPESVVPGVPREWAELCKRLMERRPEARITYEHIRAWLGAAPDNDVKPVSGTMSIAPFVGRKSALDTLEQAREHAFQGTPRAVLVSGPSGIGKTALVQEFLRRMGMRQRAFVLEGRCFERESVPYKALDSVIDALSRVLRGLPNEQAAMYAPVHADALVRVFPVLARVPALSPRGRFKGKREEQQERSLAFQALKSLLARMSDDRPIVMFIDDLQWGDRDSALLVRELLTPPDPPRLFLLGTHRSGDENTSPFLSVFAGTSTDTSLCTEVERVELTALDAQEARSLVSAMLQQEGHDASLAQLIAGESEGNPFFAGELVRSARARSTGNHARAPLSLEQVLLERFAALPVGEQALLEIITLIGRPVDRSLVLAVSGLGPAGNASFDALRSARLIRTASARDADTVECCHDRIREVVSQKVGPARRAMVHGLVARELEARGTGDAEILMLHHAEAGDTARAAHYAVQAARAASASLAFDHAARLLRRALELLPAREKKDLAELQAELGTALEHAGRSAELTWLRPSKGAASKAQSSGCARPNSSCSAVATHQASRSFIRRCPSSA